MSEYKALFKIIHDLEEEELRRIAKIYLAHYDGSNETLFFSDLKNKTEILLVLHSETVVGFTTLEVYEREWEGKHIRVVYSGDTIVDRAHWGQQALAFAWIARMGELKRIGPGIPMYWFLIVKGHRTYKYLPTFGKSFYPHWTIDRSDLKPLADALAREKFGDNYNSMTGIVEFAESRGHLKNEIAFPTEGEKTKDDVRFFLEKNPNYLRGHELVCLCEITEENMKPLTKRIFVRGML
jgi:hypothetical protein